MWKKYNACINCGTTQRPHKAKGYCNKCYGPAMQLEQIRAWDQLRSETLHRYPGDVSTDTERDFELLREGFAIELQRRLDGLKHWETSRDDSVDGHQLVLLFNRIARYAGAKSQKLYHGLSGYMDLQFNPEQRKIIYELLRRIEKDIPWKGVDLYRVFQYRETQLE